MSSEDSPVVPEGQSPPFAVVTPNDHAAWILIATALGLACFLFFGGIRTLVRGTISHGFGVDDYVLYAATALAVIQSSIILGACSKGLGKAVDLVSPEAQDEVQKMYYTSNLFFIVAVGLSKVSVVSFLRRISRMKEHRLVFSISMGFIAAWTFGSLLGIALQCNLRHPWISIDEECPGILRRWQIISALDIVLEVAIVGLVVFLVSTLQTSMSSKVTVVGIFSFRLLIIIFIAFRLDTFDHAGYTTNPFIREAPFVAWTQSELTYSLISATIPIFQNFLKSLNTGFGGIGAAESGYGYGYGGGSGSGSRIRKESSMSFQMSKLRSANKSVALEETDEEQDRDRTYAQAKNIDGLNAGPSGTTTGQWNRSEVAPNGETTSIGSDESRRMMIRKEVQWSIRTEPRQ